MNVRIPKFPSLFLSNNWSRYFQHNHVGKMKCQEKKQKHGLTFAGAWRQRK